MNQILKSEVYKNIDYLMAQRIIQSTNSDAMGGGNAFFDRAEESLLSMFIFYFKEVKKKETISEVLIGINTLFENINSIEDFHDLFVDIEDGPLKQVYTKSYFCAIYIDYANRSVGMTKEEANLKNGWLINSFNITLSRLKCRFTDIENLIKTEEIKSYVINKAFKIVSGEIDLYKWDKSKLEDSLLMFNKFIDSKLVNGQDFDVIYLAQGRVERVLTKKHSNFT